MADQRATRSESTARWSGVSSLLLATFTSAPEAASRAHLPAASPPSGGGKSHQRNEPLQPAAAPLALVAPWRAELAASSIWFAPCVVAPGTTALM